MSTEIIQVRDVPSEDVTILRRRAAARGESLSAYLRDLIHAETSQPEMAEVMARIAARTPVEADADDIGSFIDHDRR